MKKTLLIIIPILAVLLYGSIARVPADSIGIIERAGVFEPLTPGLHLLGPFAAPKAIYRIAIPETAGELKATLADGRAFSVGFEISGKLDPAQVVSFHKGALEHGADSLLKSAGENGLRSAASVKSPLDLVTGDLESEGARRAAVLLAPFGVNEVILKLRPLGEPEMLALAQTLAPARLAEKLRPALSSILASGNAGWAAHAAMGLVLESGRDPHGAEKEYLDALTLSPAALPPMAQLVAIYSAVGESGKLDRLLEAAIQAEPKSVQHLAWLAMSLASQGKLSESEVMLRHALDVEPASTQLLNNLGGVQARQANLAGAIESFRKAVAGAPADRQSLYNLGVALSAGGHEAEALPFLKKAEGLGVPNAPLLSAIAHALRRTGDARAAGEYERRVKQLAPAGKRAS